MSGPAIQGSASNVAPTLAPLKAAWEVNAEAKTSTARILGGEATIFRREDGKFAGRFEPNRDAAGDPGEDGYVDPIGIRQSLRLDECDSLFLAQQRAETLIREQLAKTHPDVAKAQEAFEVSEKAAEAGPDPF